METISTAFMGLTVGCAKCHNHMYDPITQYDFYAMKALFDPLVEELPDDTVEGRLVVAAVKELVGPNNWLAEDPPETKPEEPLDPPVPVRMYRWRRSKGFS